MNYFLPVHNLLRWAVLLFGLLAVIYAISGLISKKNYAGKDNKVGLFFMISCDIQLLIGLILYFKGVWFDALKSGIKNLSDNARFFAMEHALMMIIAWLLVHVGRSLVKRAETDKLKHKRSLLFYGIALLIILAMIPWPFREAVARQWFPHF